MLSRLSQAAVLAAILVAGRLDGQDGRGTIAGKVTDSSEAPIPGATVQIINVATGVVTRSTTNESGAYLAPFLPAGPYRVTLELAGFKTFVRGNLVLRVGDRMETNIPMEVGAVSENVTVTAESPVLETTSASSGFVVDSRRVSQMPLPHGVPFFLIQLAPGVNFAGGALNNDRPYDSWSASYAIDGSRAGRNDILIDGVPASSTNFNRNELITSWVPPADAVAEFKIETATFDASSGNSEGAAINTSVKASTNNYHGTLGYVNLNPVLAANTFFGNRAGQPRTNFSYARWGALSADRSCCRRSTTAATGRSFSWARTESTRSGLADPF